MTRNNVEFVLDDTYLNEVESAGCRAMLLIEYVPCNGDKDLCLMDAQKDMLIKRIDEMKRDYSMLPVALPGDESEFEGCLAAGRGFIHISSTGSVEACPFAPYSDVNIKSSHLKETLKSPLLTEIGLNHHLLEESEGGCALFENPEWVEGLIKKTDQTYMQQLPIGMKKDTLKFLACLFSAYCMMMFLFTRSN